MNKVLLFFLATILLCSCDTKNMTETKNEIFQNSKSNRIVQEWLNKLSLEQKVALVVGRGMDIPGFAFAEDKIKVPGQAGNTFEIPEMGIPSMTLADGPAGLRIHPTREGSEETFYCTAFPIATLLASTWNRELVREVGKAYGGEAKEYGIDIVLAPAMNIHRNPLTGRNFEYYSEDPYLSGYIAAAMVQGIQSQGVGASLKHFVANNSETNRVLLDTKLSQRALREIYLKGFEIAIQESQPWSVISSYNKINGTYVSENYGLLEQVLRDDWGYEGVVISDWWAGNSSVDKIKSGNDLIMPGEPKDRQEIFEAITNGKLSLESLDRSVTRILKTLINTLAYHNYSYSDNPDLKSNAGITRKAAAEGAVLLKNEMESLPVPNKFLKIATFGIGAYNFYSGGVGSGDVNEAYTISLVEGLENIGKIVDADLKERYSIYLSDERAKLPIKRSSFELLPPIPEMPLDEKLIFEKAAATDIALITIGRNSGEFQDRKTDGDFYLTDIEKEMIKSVSSAFKAVNKKVIIILNVGNVIETASWRDYADAILLVWQGGQEAGNSLCDVLSGKITPSGKLPTTFPMTYDNVPSAKSFPGKLVPNIEKHKLGGKGMEIEYHEDIMVGYRHYLSNNIQTAYPFGFGLSFTTFSYNNLELSSPQIEDELIINVTIKNTGKLPGKEVVQLYINAPIGNLKKPIRELKGFEKTKLLQPHESEVLTFRLNAKDLASFDSSQSAWITESGKYSIQLGASSEDIRLEAIITAKEMLVEKVSRLTSTEID